MNEEEYSYGCYDKLEEVFAEKVAQLIVKDGTYNPLVLYGCDRDKEMRILDAIACCTRREHKGAITIWKTCGDFTKDLIDAVKTETIGEFRNKYCQADLLILTRVDDFSGRESTTIQEELYYILEKRCAEYNRQTVFSCDVAPRKIVGLEDRILAHLYGGVVTSL